jgi:hypothetical protein
MAFGIAKRQAQREAHEAASRAFVEARAQAVADRTEEFRAQVRRNASIFSPEEVAEQRKQLDERAVLVGQQRVESQERLDAACPQLVASPAQVSSPATHGMPGVSQASAADSAAGFKTRRSGKARVFVAMTGLTGVVVTRQKQAESIATGKKFKRGE